MIPKTLTFTAAALSLTLSAPVYAQEATTNPPAEPAQPSEADFENAARLLSVMLSAFTSETLDESVKDQLFSCIYFNNLGVISGDTFGLIGQVSELDPTNPSHVLTAAARVCGYEGGPTGGAAAPESGEAATNEESVGR